MVNKILKSIGYAAIGILVAFVLFVVVLLVSQYRPDDFEVVSESQTTDYELKMGDTMKVITWNIGYAALGAEADFFMDGGKMVDTADEAGVYENLGAICNLISIENPDLIMMQEVDINSKRSHYVDEVEYIEKNKSEYIHSFAPNFRVLYIPYPLPTIGKVDCGLATFQKYSLTESDRIQLYCPFNKFVRAFNLRRCLMVNRIPIEDSDKEFVVVNLHLEAYDTGVGKIEQTKQLREFITEEYKKGNYVIAGGDFNQVFSTVKEETAYMSENADWKPAEIQVSEFENFTAVTDISTPTCRSLQMPYDGKEDFPAYVIDGFLISDNIEIISVETRDLDFKNSDHNPIVAEIKLK